MRKRHCILVVDDSPNIRVLFRRMFETAGYDVVEAGSATAAMARLDAARPDVILLDLGLPDRDGLELIPLLIAQSGAPVLVVSARCSPEEKVVALDLGANDVIAKPFDIGELLARVRVAVRQRIGAGGAQAMVTVADVTVDLVNRRILKAGQAVHLTPKEYAVIEELAKHQGRVISHDRLLSRVWANDHDRHIEYLRFIIRGIRTKLEADSDHPAIIRNERGVGYWMVATNDRSATMR